MQVISEEEFSQRLRAKLADPHYQTFDCVTGPGRSGAVAAVYASHFLHIPFIPFGMKPKGNLKTILIIDTAIESGRTLKKAFRKYIEYNPFIIALYQEPPRVIFWYEPPKPQFYKANKNENFVFFA